METVDIKGCIGFWAFTLLRTCFFHRFPALHPSVAAREHFRDQMRKRVSQKASPYRGVRDYMNDYIGITWG